MDEQTVDASVAFGATMPLTDSGPLAKSPSVTLPRSTVLPRVEMVGAEPRLVLGSQRRYETVRLLGEGGFGEVLRARDNDIGREVAVKRLHPEMRSPGVVARFAEEVRTIGSLEHPNIVPIHDVGVEENGDYYFVMKYVAGETLESIIDKLAAGDAAMHARFGVERRVQVFLALLEAVAFAHSRGILHRDIKPANVMIGAYGEVMLMDWGIAKRVREPAPASAEMLPPAPGSKTTNGDGARGALYQTQRGELVGTPAYMSPEQSRGDALDERSDIYALSVLLYELLTLKHPLADKTTLSEMLHGIGHESPPLAGMLNHPHQTPVPMDLSWFLQKGLAKDPAARYATVTEMIARLERRAEGFIPVQCPITFMKQTSNRLGRFIDRRPFIATFLMFASAIGAIAEVVRALH